MSSRGYSRNTFYGKRSATEKKNKRKRQAGRGSKEHLPEETPMSFEEVKKRVLISLEKMGKQVFADGADYGMENWVRSFNKLLDDFQAVLKGRGPVPPEFLSARAEVSAKLGEKPDLSAFDEELSKLNGEVASIRDASRINISEIKAKRDALLRQRTTLTEELSNLKSLLAEKRSKTESQSFFSRLFGRKDDTIPQLETRIATSESALNDIESQITQLEMTERRASTDPPRLGEISKRMSDIQAAKNSMLQFTEVRESVTKRMAEEVSKIV